MKNLEVITDSKGVRKLKVSFALWPNDDRKTDKHPNVKGYDKESGVSSVGWTKDYNGKKFLSGSVEIPLDKLPAEITGDCSPPPSEFDDDSDLPF